MADSNLIPIQGIIAAENRKTVDGRVIRGIDWRRGEKIAAYYLPVGRDQPIGYVSVVGVLDDLVIARGEFERWPEDAETLEVGVDLNSAVVEDEWDDGILTVSKGKFVGLAVYSSVGEGGAAWPFVRIWRA